MIDQNIINFLRKIKKEGSGLIIGSPEFDKLCKKISGDFQQNGQIYYISIDLVQSDLRKYYSSTGENHAYDKIRAYMIAHNFTPRKDTNYVSNSPMTKRQLYSLLNNMSETFPWLVVSASKFDVTEIKNIRIFDALSIIIQNNTLDQSLDDIREQLKKHVLNKE